MKPGHKKKDTLRRRNDANLESPDETLAAANRRKENEDEK